MTKLTKDKKYIYRVYDFTGGLMKYLFIIIILCSLCGCAGTQKATVTQVSDGALYEQSREGIVEFEFYESGAIKSVKSDSKKAPFKLFDIIKPNMEVKQ